MAEDTATKEQETKDVEGEEQKDGDGQRIPYSRFEEVNQRAKQAEKELNDLRQKITDFEDRDKSEVERERSARERAESQIEGLMNKVTVMEKGAWVRQVAAEMDFHDPEDAVSHLREQLAGMEDQRDAKRMVRKLADSKKHLVREEKKEEQRSPLGRVFAGQQVPQNQQQRTPQQRAADRELEFAQGLSQQLSQFKDGWHRAGGII